MNTRKSANDLLLPSVAGLADGAEGRGEGSPRLMLHRARHNLLQMQPASVSLVDGAGSLHEAQTHTHPAKPLRPVLFSDFLA